MGYPWLTIWNFGIMKNEKRAGETLGQSMQRAAPHAKKRIIKEGRLGQKREENVIAQDKMWAKARSKDARSEASLERERMEQWVRIENKRPGSKKYAENRFDAHYMGGGHVKGKNLGG
jgi:3-hydroxyacyl-CoA dehydrogenase